MKLIESKINPKHLIEIHNQVFVTPLLYKIVERNIECIRGSVKLDGKTILWFTRSSIVVASITKWVQSTSAFPTRFVYGWSPPTQALFQKHLDEYNLEINNVNFEPCLETK